MTYFLIADSGSTKTDWALITKQNVFLRFESKGINPYFLNEKQIEHILQKEVLPYLKKYLPLLQAVYFYGAGCSNKENTLKLKHSIHQILKTDEIHIAHDMLGAARATCQHNKGIVGILGTGSNACVYGGQSIIQTAVSYGYLFGDYGSGAHIGKTFAQHYCDNTLPKELKTTFEAAGYHPEKILEIYKTPLPSKFLAALFPFIIRHKAHPFVQTLIEYSLQKYFEIQVMPIIHEKYTMHLVGSVAYILQEDLKNIAQNYKLEIKTIVKSPMEGLIQFHQSK